MAKKYLVETSVVPVALGQSTPQHIDHFRAMVSDGTWWTSVYIRKEFLRRWILDYIYVAFAIDHFEDLSSALFYLEQDFSIRRVKGCLHAVAVALQQRESLRTPKSLAKELLHLAITELRRFDRVFSHQTRNTCGCEVGAKELKVDFNSPFEYLRAFVKQFEPILDCEVNQFLGLNKGGAASRLLAADGVRQTKSGENLEKLRAARTLVTCTQCARIGDAIIALEQSKSWCLVHIDKDFNVLCKATHRDHKQISSERAVEGPVSPT